MVLICTWFTDVAKSFAWYIERPAPICNIMFSLCPLTRRCCRHPCGFRKSMASWMEGLVRGLRPPDAKTFDETNRRHMATSWVARRCHSTYFAYSSSCSCNVNISSGNVLGSEKGNHNSTRPHCLQREPSCFYQVQPWYHDTRYRISLRVRVRVSMRLNASTIVLCSKWEIIRRNKVCPCSLDHHPSANLPQKNKTGWEVDTSVAYNRREHSLDFPSVRLMTNIIIYMTCTGYRIIYRWLAGISRYTTQKKWVHPTSCWWHHPCWLTEDDSRWKTLWPYLQTLNRFHFGDVERIV